MRVYVTVKLFQVQPSYKMHKYNIWYNITLMVPLKVHGK